MTNQIHIQPANSEVNPNNSYFEIRHDLPEYKYVRGQKVKFQPLEEEKKQILLHEFHSIEIQLEELDASQNTSLLFVIDKFMDAVGYPNYTWVQFFSSVYPQFLKHIKELYPTEEIITPEMIRNYYLHENKKLDLISIPGIGLINIIKLEFFCHVCDKLTINILDQHTPSVLKPAIVEAKTRSNLKIFQNPGGRIPKFPPILIEAMDRVIIGEFQSTFKMGDVKRKSLVLSEQFKGQFRRDFTAKEIYRFLQRRRYRFNQLSRRLKEES